MIGKDVWGFTGTVLIGLVVILLIAMFWWLLIPIGFGLLVAKSDRDRLKRDRR